MNVMTPHDLRQKNKPILKHRFRGMFEAMDGIQHHMNLVASLYIEDFTTTTHYIDKMLWDCPDSPIEVCVFDIRQGLHLDTECYYCGNPRERK